MPRASSYLPRARQFPLLCPPLVCGICWEGCGPGLPSCRDNWLDSRRGMRGMGALRRRSLSLILLGPPLTLSDERQHCQKSKHGCGHPSHRPPYHGQARQNWARPDYRRYDHTAKDVRPNRQCSGYPPRRIKQYLAERRLPSPSTHSFQPFCLCLTKHGIAPPVRLGHLANCRLCDCNTLPTEGGKLCLRIRRQLKAREIGEGHGLFACRTPRK